MSTNPVSAPHKHARVLACVLCQHRKIRCDRNFPCANCVKANVNCTPSTPAPARKRRRPNQDLQERLSRCEELIKQYAGGLAPAQQPELPPLTPVASQVESQPSDSTPMSIDTQHSWKPACKMVNEEGGVRFMDSYIWASVYDELQAMRDIVETEDPEDSSILGSDDLTPDNHTDLFFFGNPSTANIEDLQPDPVHCFKLWQIFLDRVNPLTKVVHAPTVQSYVMEAATNINNVPLHYQALLFSIYTMAVLSLSDAECVQMFGVSRETGLQRFSAGTKAALMRFNVLKNYNMSALQTLVLYMFSLQGRHDRHATWILSGTVVRIAQKMGYHRDGELLNLDPFETEMRRRVWWQIVIQDSKCAMMSGLSQSQFPPHWDTKLPQNVNDADIFPGSTEPVQPREGPTEMAFCLLLNEIFRFKMATERGNDSPAFEAAMLGQDVEGNPLHQATFDKFRARAEELEKRLIELEDRYVDANAGNVHKAALTIRPMLTNRLSEMLVPMREQPEWGSEIFGLKDNLFKVVIMGSEHKADAFERLVDTGFLWFVKMYFHLDIFAVVTGQLCQRPMGSLSDRGWAVVERVYTHYSELFDMSQKQYSVQAQFTLKAWKMREDAYMQAGRALETPPFVRRLRELAPSHEARSSAQSSTPPTTSRLQPQAQRAMEPQRHQRRVNQQRSEDLDPFLGGLLDMPALNWDMFGDMVGNSGDQLSAAVFGGLSLGNMPTTGSMGAVNDMANPNKF